MFSTCHALGPWNVQRGCRFPAVELHVKVRNTVACIAIVQLPPYHKQFTIDHSRCRVASSALFIGQQWECKPSIGLWVIPMPHVGSWHVLITTCMRGHLKCWDNITPLPPNHNINILLSWTSSNDITISLYTTVTFLLFRPPSHNFPEWTSCKGLVHISFYMKKIIMRLIGTEFYLLLSYLIFPIINFSDRVGTRCELNWCAVVASRHKLDLAGEEVPESTKKAILR